MGFGSRGEGSQRYWNAVRVWGPPAFWHVGWDQRARREVWMGHDTVVFAKGEFDDPPGEHSTDDSNERDDPAARERVELQKERQRCIRTSRSG